MLRFSRTWWGQRFIEALEEFTDPGRLGRGRSYAHNGRIVDYKLDKGTVKAKVRGSINPYFGVYKEPLYNTTIAMPPIPREAWSQVIARLASNARLVIPLLMGEMPDSIEEAFTPLDLHLLPAGPNDFITTCSCPDYANPCKHVAGVCYLLAAALDADPFLLFELRGLARDQLHAELARSPLGSILAAELLAQEQAAPVISSPSYFTRPTLEQAAAPSHKTFWTGSRRLPAAYVAASPPVVPALLIKKQGDYPPFWHRDNSFLEAMEELYTRVRTKSSQMK